ncbi:hypothetical protein IKE72_02645 [Candidatus Saccharibacteria bacterium]|nr:hypothetical protein [Candidatus Saccharibacteria bacterium]
MIYDIIKSNQSKDNNDNEIISAVFKRKDSFYDSSESIWNLYLTHLDEDGQESIMPVLECAFPNLVEKYEKKLANQKNIIKTENEKYVRHEVDPNDIIVSRYSCNKGYLI